MSIGQQLRDERIRQGVSIRTMAENTGTSTSTIQNVERGKFSPSISTLERMADTLGCEVTIELKRKA